MTIHFEMCCHICGARPRRSPFFKSFEHRPECTNFNVSYYLAKISVDLGNQQRIVE
jgi:hypothetical protein